MRKKIEWQWDDLDDSTKRAKVIGGWVLMRLQAIDTGTEKKAASRFQSSLVFIPDRDHEWHILAPVKDEVKVIENKAADFQPK